MENCLNIKFRISNYLKSSFFKYLSRNLSEKYKKVSEERE